MRDEQTHENKTAEELISGKYRVIGVLDLNMDGVFYEAENEHTGRKVILRLLKNDTPVDAEIIENISQQVRALVTSRCDHIVQILDMELPAKEHEPLVIVMESNLGDNFMERISDGTPFDPPQAVRISLDVLDAISAAHSKEIIPFGATEHDIFLTPWAGQKNFTKILSPNVESINVKKDRDFKEDIGLAGRILWRSLTAAHPDACPNDNDGASKLLEALAKTEDTDNQALSALSRICVKSLNNQYSSPDEMTKDLESTGLAQATDGEQSVSFESLPNAAFVRPHLHTDSQPTVVDKKTSFEDEYFDSYDEGPVPAIPKMVGQKPKKSSFVLTGAIGVLLGVLATILIQSLLSQKEHRSSRDFKGPPKVNKNNSKKPKSSKQNKSPLEFGIAYYSKGTKFTKQMQTLSGYLEERLKRKVHLQSIHHQEAGKRLENGTLHFAVFSPLLYVLTKKEFRNIKLFATHLAYGSTTYEGYIVVGDTSPIKTIKDLKGKSFCFVSKISGSGHLFPRALMNKEGIIPEEDFSKVIYTNSHSKSIQKVLKGECDGAAVASVSYLDAVVKGAAALRILPAVTDLIPGDAYCVSPKLNQSTVKKLERALVTFDPQRDLNKKYLGDLHRITGFVKVEDKHYDSIRRVWKASEGQKEKPKKNGVEKPNNKNAQKEN